MVIKNFELYGYQIAKGTKGTRWMSVSDRDLRELIEKLKGIKNKDKMFEVFDQDTEGWEETNQWEYEVQSKIFEALKIEHLEESKIDEYFDLKTQYTIGYQRYIREQLEAKYPKEYAEIFTS